MNRIRLTNERINRATCPSGKQQSFVWDKDVPRLALRVTANGAKAFVFESKLDRRTVRITLGSPGNWTLDKARQEARRLQTMIDQNIDPREVKREQAAARETARKEAARGKGNTLAALMALYADHCSTLGKYKHANSVRSASRCHLKEFADVPAKEITPEQIASLVRRVAEERKPRDRRKNISGGKNRTAGLLRSYLSAAYNCARRAPLSAELPSAFIEFGVKSNPVDIVPAIPVRPRNRVLSKTELAAYLKALNSDDHVDMALRLAVYAGGQRLNQLMRVKLSDYDDDAKTLLLWDAKGRRRTPREHLVPLGAVGAEIVKTLAERSNGSGFLFPSSIGKPLGGEKPSRRVFEISGKIGGDPFNVLDVRRTCETHLASLGVSQGVRAQLLSHGLGGVQTVHYDRYSYIKEKREAIATWETFLARVVNGDR